mgnify:CR=1 FL=1
MVRKVEKKKLLIKDLKIKKIYTKFKTIILKKTSKQDFKTRVSEKLLKNLLD